MGRLSKVDFSKKENRNKAQIVYEDIEFDDIPKVEYETDYDIDNEKTYKKAVKRWKSLCHKCNPYREMMNFLKWHNDFNRCAFLPNVRSEKGKKVKIEIHHSPFTITEIITTVMRKRDILDERMYDSDIVKEVMELHYAGYIGLVPLSSTLHDMIHNETVTDLFIPVDIVFGASRIQEYVNMYYDYMPDNQIEKWERACAMTEAIKDEDLIPDYLTPKYLYKKIHGIKYLSADRIQELMNEQDD